MFATNFKKQLQNKHKEEFEEAKQRKPGEWTVPRQEERARHLHHNYKKQ